MYVPRTPRRAGAERGERRRGGRGAGKHNTRRHMAYGRRETRRCEAMRSRRCEAMRGIQHGGTRMAKTPEDGGAKADDRGQGMTRLIAAPRPTRFDLKNGSRRTETSTLDSRGPRYDTEL